MIVDLLSLDVTVVILSLATLEKRGVGISGITVDTLLHLGPGPLRQGA